MEVNCGEVINNLLFTAVGFFAGFGFRTLVEVLKVRMGRRG